MGVKHGAQRTGKRSVSVKRSTDRILTSHVGSLPRPAVLLEMNDARASGRPIDRSVWSTQVKTAVLEVVRLQRESGVGIVNDGELVELRE